MRCVEERLKPALVIFSEKIKSFARQSSRTTFVSLILNRFEEKLYKSKREYKR